MTLDILDHLSTVDAPTVDRLHARLEADAAAAGLLDIAYRTIDSPIGTLLLATTEQGMLRVAFEREGLDSVLDGLARDVSPRVLRAPGRLDDAARELDEYFSSRRRSFDLPLDLRLARGFRRTVLERLTDIGYGRTASYGQVAEAAGNPRAARAVGSACRTNPLPLIVPCHRVVRSDGTIGEYLGGVEAKRLLLSMEAVA